MAKYLARDGQNVCVNVFFPGSEPNLRFTFDGKPLSGLGNWKTEIIWSSDFCGIQIHIIIQRIITTGITKLPNRNGCHANL